MQEKKTGKLFGFCCESIAILKGKRLKKRKVLKDIGSNIGLLFQIADDLIDFKGDSKIVGKPTKSDIKKGKATLVNFIGFDETLKFAKKLELQTIKKIKKCGNNNMDLVKSVNYILTREF